MSLSMMFKTDDACKKNRSAAHHLVTRPSQSVCTPTGFEKKRRAYFFCFSPPSSASYAERIRVRVCPRVSVCVRERERERERECVCVCVCVCVRVFVCLCV